MINGRLTIAGALALLMGWCGYELTAAPTVGGPSASVVTGSAVRADHYDEALEIARASGRRIVVLQRGSDWNQAGEVIYTNVWRTEAFAEALGDGYVLVTVDQPEVLGGHAVRGQCTERYCRVAPNSETAIGSSAPLRLAALTRDPAEIPANDILAIETTDGSVFRPRDDSAWLAAPSPNPANETLTLKLRARTGGNILRLDFPTDPSLRGNGPGRASNSNFVINEVTVQVAGVVVKPTAAWGTSPITPTLNPWEAIDGVTHETDTANGWNGRGDQHRDRTLMVTLERAVPAGAEVTVTLNCRSKWAAHVPGCVRAAFVTDAQTLDDVVQVATAQRTYLKNKSFDWWSTTICPRVALLDSEGRGVGAENKPRIGLTPTSLAARVRELDAVRVKRDALWAAAEKTTGPERAELLRQGLDAMGYGAWTGNGHCYRPIHERIKAADPEDRSGVQRWIRFGSSPHTGVPWASPNWLEALKTPKRTDADYAEALRRIDLELSDPRNKILSTEQIQRMMMAKFHLYRGWAGHQDKRFDVQREIAELDPDTFWGIGAAGYLGMHKRSQTPMITYGWAPNQLKPGVQTWDLTDTAVRFDHAGSYMFAMTHVGGRDTLKVHSIAVLDGDRVVSESKEAGEVGPGRKVVTPLDLSTWRPDRKYTVRVVVEAPPEKLNSHGRFSIAPEFVTPEGWQPPVVEQSKPMSPLAQLAYAEIERSCGAQMLKEIAERDGGEAFLTALRNDVEWMESFLASGVARFNEAIENLAFLYIHAAEDFENPIVRRLATAMALNVRASHSRYALLDRFKHTQRAFYGGLLHIAFEGYTVREMRRAIVTTGSAAEYQFLLDDRQTTAGAYLGACWAIGYRRYNVYGDSVQGSAYISPWMHAMGTGAGDRPFIAHRQVGGVCGTLSGYGSVVARAHGVMASTVGQPGHCAYVVRIGDAWPIGNSVSGPSATGFGVPGWDGADYTTVTRLWETVEADRESFMNAQRLIWRARAQLAAAPSNVIAWRKTFEQAIAAQPINYGTWIEYLRALEKAPEVSPEVWNGLAMRAARQFAAYNQAGWALVMRCLNRTLPKMEPAQRVQTLLAVNRLLTQDNWPRPLAYNYRNVLNWQAARIGDRLRTVEYFGELLKIHHSDNPANNWIFASIMNWGNATFAAKPDTATAYAEALERFYTANAGDVAESSMASMIAQGIRKSSVAGDVEAFRQWADMAAKLLPAPTLADVYLKPAQVAGAPKIVPFPGQKLSTEGMLQTSSACKHDRPLTYAAVLDEGVGGWFDTNGETAPWAQVQLAGDCELSGVVLVNRYEFAGNAEFDWAVPLVVSVSTDGESWTPVARFDKAEPAFRVDLGADRPRARFVRIERVAPADGKPAGSGRFHFRNFIVYGKKLY